MGSGLGRSGNGPRPKPERVGRYSTKLGEDLIATKTRNKTAVRTTKGKGGRRPTVKARGGPDLMLLPIAVGVILVLLAAGVVVYYFANRHSNTPAQAANIPCDALQHTQNHYHVGLQIVYQGNLLPIPSNIGIQGDPTAPTCYYWLHVHTANQNTIHIEAPASRTFTLGDFFSVWTTWNQSQGLPAEPLDPKHVSTLPALTAGQQLVIYVDQSDGKGPQLYTGNPRAIVLKPHEIITLEISPPTITPPPFTFAAGL
jgi:hypothetical protein